MKANPPTVDRAIALAEALEQALYDVASDASVEEDVREEARGGAWAVSHVHAFLFCNTYPFRALRVRLTPYRPQRLPVHVPA